MCFKELNMADDEELNIEVFFSQSFEFIKSGMRFGNVLVQGNLGISRSAAIVLAFLMNHLGWNLEKAFWVLKVRRSIVNPNEGFMKALFKYEWSLFGKNSLAVRKIESNIPKFIQEVLKK